MFAPISRLQSNISTMDSIRSMVLILNSFSSYEVTSYQQVKLAFATIAVDVKRCLSQIKVHVSSPERIVFLSIK